MAKIKLQSRNTVAETLLIMLGGASGVGGGNRLLDEWFYFDRPEPRLGATYQMHYLPTLAKGVGIYHCQPGNAEGRG